MGAPRRDGLWDGFFIEKTAKWLAQIEEDGLEDEGYVPYEMATNVNVTNVNVLTRTARLQAFLKEATEPTEEGIFCRTRIQIEVRKQVL